MLPFPFFLSCHAQLSHTKKNVLIFISFPILSLSFFYFPRPLRQEREGRATTEGQQTREGVPLGSRRLGTFLILFFVLSSQKSLTGFRSINRVMNLFFLILVFYALFHSPSFAGANYWSLLSLSSQNGVLKERRKMKKKQFFEIIHEVRNIKFLLSSPVLLSFFFSFRYLSFLPSFSSRPHSGFPLFLIKGERTGKFPFFLNKVNLNYSFCGGKWPSVPDSIPLVYSKMDVLLSTIISYTLKYNIIKKTQQQLINIILTLVSILELCIHKESKSEHI